MSSSTILVADDDAAIRTVLNQALSRAGYQVRVTSNAATLWRWVSEGEGDLVITDVVMPDENAFDLMPRIRRQREALPIIVMSAQNTFMTAIRASEQGAYEYLPKPFDLNELIGIVGRALSAPKAKPRARPANDEDGDAMPLVGRSPAMQEIYRVLARLMQTDLTVLISGESGTGKELVAKSLHDFGRRSVGNFVAINMAAIPRDLIEAELFGHEKGAFTGAQARNSGRFEQAEGGTLFLDEIGDMPLEAQTRLLRVLQQGEYTTVGGRVPIKTDVRIVAATNKDLRQLIQQGLFREDLYYRLNVVPLAHSAAPGEARGYSRSGAALLQAGVRRRAAAQTDRWAGIGIAQQLQLAGQCARARKSCAASGGALPAGHDHRANRGHRTQ
jgi:two-component system nitrogen regulation response regulator GlnG